MKYPRSLYELVRNGLVIDEKNRHLNVMVYSGCLVSCYTDNEIVMLMIADKQKKIEYRVAKYIPINFIVKHVTELINSFSHTYRSTRWDILTLNMFIKNRLGNVKITDDMMLILSTLFICQLEDEFNLTLLIE